MFGEVATGKATLDELEGQRKSHKPALTPVPLSTTRGTEGSWAAMAVRRVTGDREVVGGSRVGWGEGGARGLVV